MKAAAQCVAFLVAGALCGVVGAAGRPGCGRGSHSVGFVTPMLGAGALALRGASRTPPARSGAVGACMMFPDHAGDFKAGDKVRVVSDDVVFFHVKPAEFPDGYTVPKGAEGVVFKVATEDRQGRAVSANRPLIIKFEDPKFQAHFEACELEKL
mmetsp:Transcript_41140/g.102916  ORF Transcript_41140/g.102916 Transcript_41140/m.102916 type:complete len:154 (-) Transcript_41140:62-523(-)|eukprot:CAMPEP_0173421890 /NCGR_PEP_ID=MMETSP1357-20121228/2818_1 /TAXON_ID=77926 /ORGANISM="Hemiselmis rufescens, Strain PCC563" /LENGTH=153 /DNA_ID=CAMNT_0014384851 /DNA_START=36 /DNA_END=497 /DNA_ORIENTATION=+